MLTLPQVITRLEKQADEILRNVSLEERRALFEGRIPSGWSSRNPKVRIIRRIRTAIQKLSS